MSMTSITVTGSMSLRFVELHIHKNLTGSAADPTASSRSEDRHEPNGGSGFDDAIGKRREYGMN